MFNTVNKNFRPFFYSLAISLGLFLSIDEFRNVVDKKNFLVFFGATLIIYTFELIILAYENKDDVSLIQRTYPAGRNLIKFSNIFILPISVIIFTIIFGLISINQTYLFIITLFVLTLLFIILFKHLHNALKENLYNELETHYSFDLLKLFLIFLGSIIIAIFNIEGIGSMQSQLLMFFLLNFFLTSIVYSKLPFKYITYLFFTVLTSGIVSATFAALTYTKDLERIHPISLGLYFALLFYVMLSIVQQKALKELHFSGFLKQTLILAIATALIFLI